MKQLQHLLFSSALQMYLSSGLLASLVPLMNWLEMTIDTEHVIGMAAPDFYFWYKFLVIYQL